MVLFSSTIFVTALIMLSSGQPTPQPTTSTSCIYSGCSNNKFYISCLYNTEGLLDVYSKFEIPEDDFPSGITIEDVKLDIRGHVIIEPKYAESYINLDGFFQHDDADKIRLFGKGPDGPLDCPRYFNNFYLAIYDDADGEPIDGAMCEIGDPSDIKPIESIKQGLGGMDVNGEYIFTVVNHQKELEGGIDSLDIVMFVSECPTNN